MKIEDTCFGEHFCCMIGSLPSNYSSMHLRLPFKARVVQNTILEEMKHRLLSWKHCICQKGEYTFQFTNLLPLYFISFFYGPPRWEIQTSNLHFIRLCPQLMCYPFGFDK